MPRLAFVTNLICVAGSLLLAAAPAGATPSPAPQTFGTTTTTGQPTTVTLTGQDARVPGFRSAVWGMTVEQVRAALARDFGGARASALIADPVSGNKAIIAPMASLAPGPGPAAISYIFGARSKRLIHVNLDWTVATPSAAQRTAIVDAGSKIVAGFAGNYWKIGSVMRGVVVQRDLLVLFTGTDNAGGGVDVRLGGVPYSLRRGGAVRTVDASTGPATLHVGFSAPASSDKTMTIKPGAF